MRSTVRSPYHSKAITYEWHHYEASGWVAIGWLKCSTWLAEKVAWVFSTNYRAKHGKNYVIPVCIGFTLLCSVKKTCVALSTNHIESQYQSLPDHLRHQHFKQWVQVFAESSHRFLVIITLFLIRPCANFNFDFTTPNWNELWESFLRLAYGANVVSQDLPLTSRKV